VEAMSLGANYFVFARNVSEYSENILDLAPGYKSYFVPLYDLISEQVIAPIEEPRALVISPMALQEIADPLEIERRGLGTKVYWQEIYRMKGMLDTGFLLQSTRENYLPRYCYNMSKYYDGLFPKNRNGYVTLFTGAVDPLQVQGIQQYFVVKGGHLYTRKGKVLTARKVKDFISVFDELGGSLPFRTPDAFLSAHRIKDGYKVYMINPHMFDNKDVEARLYHNLEKKEVIIRDVISGEAWPLAKGSPCSITLPAGLFRILKVHVN
jgi:hypothetical protein